MELALVIVVVAFALGFDYTNGFHDAANAIATSVSTRALTPRAALVMAAVFNLLGALLWAVGVTSLGYLLGGFAFVQHNIEYILIAIVLVSVAPMVVEALRKRAELRRAAVEVGLVEPDPTTARDGLSG